MDIRPDNTLKNTVAQNISVGATLRAARECAGLSLTDVAGHLKFAPRQIEALEADDFSHLPEMPFVRGFVRNYAKLLQIDAVPLLVALPDVPTKTVDALLVTRSKNVPLPGVYAARKYNIAWLGGGLVVALVLAIFLELSSGTNATFKTKVVKIALPEATSIAPSAPIAVTANTTNSVSSKRPLTAPSPIVKPPSTIPASAIPASAMPASAISVPRTVLNPVVQPMRDVSQAASATSITQATVAAASSPSTMPQVAQLVTLISMVFEEDAWAEVMDKDGVVLMAQLNFAGSERKIRGVNPPFTVKIGNASKVQ